MNRLRECVKKFIYEKQQIKDEITKIEEERNVIAQQRNGEKFNKNFNTADTFRVEAEINELGRKIAELGNRSQKLQNELDFKYIQVKNEINLEIDGLIFEEMQKIRDIQEEKEEVQEEIERQKNRALKFEQQKQEFYARFGREPELSENSLRENKSQEEKCEKNKARIIELEEEITKLQDKISHLAQSKRKFKNGNFSNILNEIDIEEKAEKEPEESIVLPFTENVEEIIAEEETDKKENVEKVLEEFEPIEEIETEEIETEEIEIEEFEPIEEIKIEEFEPIEEIEIEDFEPIEEIKIEEFKPIEELKVEEFKPVEEIAEEAKEEKIEKKGFEQIHKIEENDNIEEAVDLEDMMENYVKQMKNEEIKQEATMEIKSEEVPELQEEMPEAIVEKPEIKEEPVAVAVEEQETREEPVNFGERVTLINIIAKIENGEIVYKAELSNGNTISVHPSREDEGKILERDKENRNEIKEILINYSIAEYRILDKKVIKKVDPVVCELLVRFAKKYNYDAQSLIYSYAMTFSKNDEAEIDSIPQIVYNLYFGKETKVTKKEKDVLLKICKNARKNEKVEIIGYNTGLSRIKYIFKRTLNVNDANALPEGKY
jgi:hypothetical protein